MTAQRRSPVKCAYITADGNEQENIATGDQHSTADAVAQAHQRHALDTGQHIWPRGLGAHTIALLSRGRALLAHTIKLVHEQYAEEHSCVPARAQP